MLACIGSLSTFHCLSVNGRKCIQGKDSLDYYYYYYYYYYY